MIRLAIIEDNALYRTALQTYLKSTEGIEIVYLEGSVTRLLENASLNPDVVIMDIDLGKESGIEGVQKIKQVFPRAGIFMLTVFEDDEKIFQSIKAGALGYLLKKDPPGKIVDAIQNIYKGESVMNGQIARKVLNYFITSKSATTDFETYRLAKHEKRILLLLLDGLSYEEIATKCFISIYTINTPTHTVYPKLSVHRRTEITTECR